MTSAPVATTPTPSTVTSSDSWIGSKAGELREDNSLKMKLIWCPPGTFTMGSPKSETDASGDENQVAVTLTNGFWLGKTEVTQQEWQAVMATTPWAGQSDVKEGDEYPATYVNWGDVTEFCRKLTYQERKAGRLPAGWEYTLPTEAQWEYACRAGAKTRFSFGDDYSKIGDYAWYGGIIGDGNAKTEPYAHQVGRKPGNPWGLRDIHGNVWEWCRDWYSEKLPGGTDPEVSFQASGRVIRGGSWGDSPQGCRSARRGTFSSDGRVKDLGFRVAASRSSK